jgi:hypothetical protein
MKNIAFILAIVMAFSLMTIINAGEVKHVSNQIKNHFSINIYIFSVP